MEYIIGFAFGIAFCVGVPIWLLNRSWAAHQQKQRIENWEGPFGKRTLRINFVHMRASEIDIQMKAALATYPVRRLDRGRWERARTADKWEPIGEAYEPSIEVAYQRYLRED
jgi:hypothetical protein